MTELELAQLAQKLINALCENEHEDIAREISSLMNNRELKETTKWNFKTSHDLKT